MSKIYSPPRITKAIKMMPSSKVIAGFAEFEQHLFMLWTCRSQAWMLMLQSMALLTQAVMQASVRHPLITLILMDRKTKFLALRVNSTSPLGAVEALETRWAPDIPHRFQTKS